MVSVKPGGVQGQILDKIPEKSFSKRKESEAPAVEDKLANLVSMKLSEDELAFLKEYRRLEDLEREKGIKFFECIGDPPATDQFKDGVKDKRNMLVEQGLNKMRAEDTHRFAVEVNKDKVVVPTTVNIAARPKWDVY
jgi:hypothetical protein